MPATTSWKAGCASYGLPASLYVDRDSIYRCEAVASIAQQLAEKPPQTQFGRAMEQLGVELILANSPQAKGRVERMNGVLQDRLVKELRLAGINDLESANRFLDETVFAAVQPAFCPGGGQSAGCASGRAARFERNLELGRAASGARGLDCGVRGQTVSVGPAHEPLSLVGARWLSGPCATVGSSCCIGVRHSSGEACPQAG